MTKTNDTDWLAIKQQLESEPLVWAWKQFESLTAIRQQEIWEEWNEYYRQCKDSPIGTLSREVADTMKQEIVDKQKIKALLQLNKDLREMGNTIKKPSLFEHDPMSFSHDWRVLKYKKALRLIK